MVQIEQPLRFSSKDPLTIWIRQSSERRVGGPTRVRHRAANPSPEEPGQSRSRPIQARRCRSEGNALAAAVAPGGEQPRRAPRHRRPPRRRSSTAKRRCIRPDPEERRGEELDVPPPQIPAAKTGEEHGERARANRRAGRGGRHGPDEEGRRARQGEGEDQAIRDAEAEAVFRAIQTSSATTAASTARGSRPSYRRVGGRRPVRPGARGEPGLAPRARPGAGVAVALHRVLRPARRCRSARSAERGLARGQSPA